MSHFEHDDAYRHPWSGVELRHLATLTAVARTGSFRQAAKELGYVQSAVSQQVARLERVVGVRLVDRQRGQRNVHLTRGGEMLAERGERILGALQAARIDLALTAGGASRPVRLAITCDAAPVLGRLLGALGEELAQLPIHVTEVLDGDELVPLLERGAADVAIGAPLSAPGISSAVLLHDPFVLLVRPRSPLAAASVITDAAEIADEPLIVPSSALAHSRLHASGLRLDRALRVPLASAVPELVAKGLGVGLLPRSAAQETRTGLARVATAGLIAPQRMVLGWHSARRRTTHVQGFCDAALRVCFEDAVPDRAHAA